MHQHSLISDLYAAANGRVAWEEALGGLADYLGLWMVQLLSIDGRNGNLLFSAYGGTGCSPEVALNYVRYFNTIDPRIPLALAPPANRLTASSDETKGNVCSQASSFHREFLHPYGGGNLVGTKLAEVEHVQFLLALVTPPGPATAEQTHFESVKDLMHHFCEAVRNMAHVHKSYEELGMARELLDQFDYPMLLIDESRRIRHKNKTACAALQCADVLFEQGGYVVCRKSSNESAVTEAIASLRTSAPSLPQERSRRVVCLTKPDMSPYLAFLSSMRPQDTMGVFGDTPALLMVLHDPGECRSSLDPFIVAECFDLTPAEARVAVQIVNGASSKEIAQRSGAALPTVRTQLKRVMEKTGVSRQSDLVRLLLGVPSRLK